MPKKLFLFLVIPLFIYDLCLGVQVSGIVKDTHKKRVPSVTVIVKNSDEKTVTGQDGKFTLNVPDNRQTVTLIFNRYGFHPVEYQVNPGKGIKTIEILFIPREVLLQQVTVTATNKAKEELSVPVAESSVSELELQSKMPENLIEGLSETPGVHFIGSGGFAITPSIRGLARHRVLMMVDGARVTSDRRAGTSASFALPELTQRVEVIRSASSVLYGSDAIGGVINVLSRNSSEPKAQGKNSLNLSWDSVNKRMNTGLSLNQHFGKWNTMAAFQYLNAKDYKAPDVTVLHSAYKYYSGLLDISFNDSKRNIYIGYIGGQGKDVGKPDRTNNPLKYSIVPSESDHFIRMGWTEKTVAKNASLDFSFYLNPSTYRLDKYDIKKNNIQHSDTEGTNLGVRTALKKSIGNHFSYQAGMEWYSRQNIRMINKDTTGTKVVMTEPMTDGIYNDYGLFLAADYTGIPTVIIDAGLRYNFFSGSATVENKKLERNDNSPSFFIGITKKITPSISVFGSIGRAFRFPSLSELFYSGITGRSAVIGNPLLKPESSLNIDAGLKMATRKLNMGVYVFTYDVKQMIERYLTTNNIYTYDNIMKGRIYGSEVEIQYSPVSHLDIFGNGFYFKGKNVDDDVAINDVPAPRIQVGTRVYIDRFLGEINYIHSFKKSDPGPAELANKSFGLLNFKGSYHFSSSIAITMKLSNILNKTYYPNADPDIPLARGFEASGGIYINF